MAIEQVEVPDIGGSEDAEVVEVLVAVGDTIEIEQSLVVLESDKASMEIPSTLAGTIVEILVAEGEQLSEGAPLMRVEVAGDAVQEPVGEAAEAAPVRDPESEAVAPAATVGSAVPAAAAQDSAQPQVVQVAVPDIGGSEGAEVVELLVGVGDQVALEQGLIVLESDKASMEIPSTAAGVVLEILVSEGDTLSEGSPVARIESSGGAGQDAAPSEPTPAPAASAAQQPAPVLKAPPEAAAATVEKSSTGGVYAGPAVRKLAREFGVPLARVKGSGPRGRVLKEDLHQFVQKALEGDSAEASGPGLPVVPEVDFSKFGEVEVVPRSKLDKLTASNMQRSWLNVPHVTQFDDADITDLEEFRRGLKAEAEKRGTRISPLPFVLKACAVALRDNPQLNSSLASGGQELVYKHYCHIGMAVDTPAGLVVPVLRDVDRKSVWEVAAEVIELAGKARDRKLSPAQMQGGCFTVSSLGNIGGRGFTPIVNTPEVGILGVSKAGTSPQWDGSAFVPRTMLPLALSYDHRVVNGGDGGRFLTRVVELLGDIRQLLM